MKTGKSKRIARVCGIIVILILAIFLLSACSLFRKQKSFESVFFNNWGIVLPENMELEFSKSEPGPFGEGTRYAVLRPQTEPTEFIADFLRERDEEFENAVNKRISGAEYEIPENFLPDWEAEYFWKHVGKNLVPDTYGHGVILYGNNLYMIYFPDSLMLVICQHFT